MTQIGITGMSRYLSLCAKALLLPALLLGSISCDFGTPSPERKAELASAILGRLASQPPANWSAEKIDLLKDQLPETAVTDILIDWALRYPSRFVELLKQLRGDTFNRNFAQRIAEQGRSFVFIERFSGLKGVGVEKLLKHIAQVEQRDRRTKVPAHKLSLESPLRRIARLEGEFDGVKWQGAAVLLAQSRCQLGFATAGHNVLNGEGVLRAPPENIKLNIGGVKHALVEALPTHPPSQPEQDWTLLIADKPYCGKEYNQAELAFTDDRPLPQQGLQVGLYCYHQSSTDVMASLYQEQCRIYPSDAGVLDYYRAKPPGRLGIHTCFSEKGSSGCPILFRENQKAYFVGTQIEGDAETGAGIARLFSDEFAQALTYLQQRFAKDDEGYRASVLTISANDNDRGF